MSISAAGRAAEVDKKVKEFEDRWARMDALHKEVSLNDDPGFTILEYAKKYGLKRGTAKERLAKMADEGKLIEGFRVINGARNRVYRFPKE